MNTLSTVFTSSFIHEIHIAKNKLDLNGINNYIENENITSTIGTAFVEGYKLKVNSVDLEKASKILSTPEK